MKEEIKDKIKEQLINILSQEIAQSESFEKIKEAAIKEMLNEFGFVTKEDNSEFKEKMGFSFNRDVVQSMLNKSKKEQNKNRRKVESSFESGFPSFLDTLNLKDKNATITTNDKEEKMFHEILSGSKSIPNSLYDDFGIISELKNVEKHPIENKETPEIKKQIFKNLRRKDLKIVKMPLSANQYKYRISSQTKGRVNFVLSISSKVNITTRRREIDHMTISIGNDNYYLGEITLETTTEILNKVQELEQKQVKRTSKIKIETN